jgi:hypothetical protein
MTVVLMESLGLIRGAMARPTDNFGPYTTCYIASFAGDELAFD